MVSSVDPAHERLWFLQSLFVLQRLYFKDCLFRKFFSSFCHHDLKTWSSLSVVPVRTISGGPVRQWDSAFTPSALPRPVCTLCTAHLWGAAESLTLWLPLFFCYVSKWSDGDAAAGWSLKLNLGRQSNWLWLAGSQGSRLHLICSATFCNNISLWVSCSPDKFRIGPKQIDRNSYFCPVYNILFGFNLNA